MQTETVHHRFLPNRVRAWLEHERAGLELASAVHGPDFESPALVVHLEVDLDFVPAVIVMAVLDDVHENLFDTELHLEAVLLREPVPVGKVVHCRRDPFQLAAVVGDDQAKASVSCRVRVGGRLVAVDVAGRPVSARNLARRCRGLPVSPNECVQRCDIDGGFHRVLCAPGRPAQVAVLQDESLDCVGEVGHQRCLPQEVERPRVLREAQVPVEDEIGYGVVVGQAEQVHRRSGVFGGKPRSV